MKFVFLLLLIISTSVLANESHKINVTDEVGCLTEAIYFEARNQSTAGQLGVANVIINRVRDDRWANSVCLVINQKFQFSYTHQVKDKSFYDKTAYRKAMKLAEVVYFNAIVDITDSATMYHHVDIKPKWNWSKLKVTVVIDDHVFYQYK